MKFVTRELDLALNLLEILYKTREMWTLSALATHLSEPETSVYRALRVLVKSGYVLSAQGAGGGYRTAPLVGHKPLIRLFNDFKVNQAPSVLTGNRASGRVLNRVVTLLTCLKLSDILGEEIPSHIPEPPEAA